MKAVVIGSGIGGLTSAILLAKRGWEVTVLEQHYRAGGSLHRFFREGAGYDVGVHYIGSIDRNQMFGKALMHLGVYDKLSWRSLNVDGFDRLQFPGFEIDVPVGLNRWIQRLSERFPEQRSGLLEYAALHRDATVAYDLFNSTASPISDTAALWESRSLDSVLRSLFSDERLRSVLAGFGAPLYGVSPSQAPFGMHAVITDHFLGGAYILRGGGDRLALSLCHRLRALGGKVLLRHEVSEILVSQKAVSGVRCTNDAQWDADLVVANLHPKQVLKMLPESSVRPIYRNRILEAEAGFGHYGVYLMFDQKPEVLKDRNLYHYQTWDMDQVFKSNEKGFPTCLFLCSGEAQAVSGMVPAAQSIWTDQPVEKSLRSNSGPMRSVDYLAKKSAMSESILKLIRSTIPERNIIRAEFSTPASTAHYLRTPDGATYGHRHTVDQMGRFRLPKNLRIDQLVHVGQSVGFPGVCGAMVSAYLAIGSLIGLEELIEELRVA